MEEPPREVKHPGRNAEMRLGSSELLRQVWLFKHQRIHLFKSHSIWGSRGKTDPANQMQAAGGRQKVGKGDIIKISGVQGPNTGPQWTFRLGAAGTLFRFYLIN